MRHHSDSSSPAKASLYQEVTDRIIVELEAGRLPWVQPWGRAKAGVGLPSNAATGRRYSGINILILWGEVIAQGYPAQNWLTFRQALALGGAVRKGARGCTVFFANRFVPKGEKARAIEQGTEPETVPFLKRFTVFNVAQCDGLPETLTAGADPLPERQIIPQAEALIKATGADLRIGGDRAFYSPAEDFIRVPPQPAFFEQINYYHTCFHELGHWSGHPTRLARDFSKRFGSTAYAREELVAEMAGAFVCAALSITVPFGAIEASGFALLIPVISTSKEQSLRRKSSSPDTARPQQTLEIADDLVGKKHPVEYGARLERRYNSSYRPTAPAHRLTPMLDIILIASRGDRPVVMDRDNIPTGESLPPW